MQTIKANKVEIERLRSQVEGLKEDLEAIRNLSGLDNELIGGTSVIVSARISEIHQRADSALATLEFSSTERGHG